jgi:hypothetical protein
MVGFLVDKCSAACADWNHNFKCDYAFSTISRGTGIKKNIYNLHNFSLNRVVKKNKYRYLGENPRFLHVLFQCVVLFFLHMLL